MIFKIHHSKLFTVPRLFPDTCCCKVFRRKSSPETCRTIHGAAPTSLPLRLLHHPFSFSSFIFVLIFIFHAIAVAALSQQRKQPPWIRSFGRRAKWVPETLRSVRICESQRRAEKTEEQGESGRTRKEVCCAEVTLESCVCVYDGSQCACMCFCVCLQLC